MSINIKKFVCYFFSDKNRNNISKQSSFLSTAFNFIAKTTETAIRSIQETTNAVISNDYNENEENELQNKEKVIVKNILLNNLWMVVLLIQQKYHLDIHQKSQ